MKALKDKKLEFLDEVEEIAQDNLQRLEKLCKQQMILENDNVDADMLSEILTTLERFDNIMSIEMMKQVLAHYEKKLDRISQNYIPAIMNETGLQELTLKNGYKVIVEDKLRASISDKNNEQAYNSMINEKIKEGCTKEEATLLINDLFKEQITITDNEIIADAKMLLFESNIEFDTKKNIHYQTLQKYCKEQLANGKEIPAGISHYEYQETKIKKKN